MSKHITKHPGKVSYQDRCELLQQQGVVIWFTGLSGSGKSTIAVELEKQLYEKGHLVYRLDGDNIRHSLNADLGFSTSDRKENVRRIAEMAALLQKIGIITLVSCISPHQDMREKAKQIIGAKNFIEIYIKASLETCIKRDPKQLYKKAANNEIQKMTGITAEYEAPQTSDLVINTESCNIAEAVETILKYVEEL